MPRSGSFAAPRAAPAGWGRPAGARPRRLPVWRLHRLCLRPRRRLAPPGLPCRSAFRRLGFAWRLPWLPVLRRLPGPRPFLLLLRFRRLRPVRRSPVRPLLFPGPGLLPGLSVRLRPGSGLGLRPIWLGLRPVCASRLVLSLFAGPSLPVLPVPLRAVLLPCRPVSGCPGSPGRRFPAPCALLPGGPFLLRLSWRSPPFVFLWFYSTPLFGFCQRFCCFCPHFCVLSGV